MIHLQNVTKIYSNGQQHQYVLNSISLQFTGSEFIGIVGRSGSGKTTLLHILSGIESPSYGSCKILGTDLSTLSEKKLSRWRAENIGMVFQSFHLLPSLSLLENVMLPMEFSSKYKRKERKARALQLLNSVGLSEKANHFPDGVSGGEKQRTAIARALANDPPLLFADEPTGNLDSENAAAVLKIFSGLAKQGRTIIMVTHDPEVQNYTSRTISVKDGCVLDTKAAAGAEA
ncbi:ABC transporter ATP-binding protein [Metabacillus lacus]|uniref:ABC transporter ATP-binding protein n=1 Tax=Metabacillus lacus TaxID=1983721 RepID=UPI001BA58C19|nr:ABC transporter ATP-binding protein [Metabacillus lacus]